MEFQEICRKLKPIIGERADRYWLAYLAEDYRGKQELEMALGLIAVKLLGNDLDEKRVHLTAPSRQIAGGEYPVGWVVYNDRRLYPFGIREEEWIQHAAIFGRSGAGKTNTVFIMLENLLNKKRPFLIFDWKRNYRDLLAVRSDEILVYTVGRDAVPGQDRRRCLHSGMQPELLLLPQPRSDFVQERISIDRSRGVVAVP